MSINTENELVLFDYSREGLIQRLNNGEQLEFLFFWSHHQHRTDVITRACLSQWYPSEFVLDGIRYSCAEQYMMAEKACMMKNGEILSKIMASSDPREMKTLGRSIPNFNTDKWKEIMQDVVLRANIAKFEQNPRLLHFLQWSGNRILVEASPSDAVWGIGLRASDERAQSPLTWQGTNYLGIALMKTRDKLC